MFERFDDAVVGAGILGLAHAYQLASRGRRVLVLERGQRAQGASIRNFGMLWPIGQPEGPRRDLALRSLEIWRDLLAATACWHEPCGSLHVAYHDDEANVLTEFADRARGSLLPCEVLSPEATRDHCRFVKPGGLKLGLFSPTEVCVDPREIVARLPAFLGETLGVHFAFGQTVIGFERPQVRTTSRIWEADRLWVCSGDDLETLYPETYRSAGLVPCKLQMMRTEPLPGERFGPMIAAGSTLRHYTSFEGCPSLPALKARFAAERPELDRFGIHVMASQNGLGELILGDSHEYGSDMDPFDKAEIDAMVLDYLATFLDLPDARIAARWHGIYVKPRDGLARAISPEPGVVVTTGVGGAGMTLSFGLAEQVVRDTLNEG